MRNGYFHKMQDSVAGGAMERGRHSLVWGEGTGSADGKQQATRLLRRVADQNKINSLYAKRFMRTRSGKDDGDAEPMPRTPATAGKGIPAQEQQ